MEKGDDSFPYIFFRHENGKRKPLDQRRIQREFKRLTKEAEIEDLHFHDLRRTFGQTLVDLNFDLLTIKNAMAHKSIQATLRYVRSNEQKVNEAFDRIGEYWDVVGVKNGVNSGVKNGVNSPHGSGVLQR